MTRFILAFLLAASAAASAQENDEKAEKPAKLFEEESMMEITLTGPWRQVMRYKSSDRRHDGSLTYTTASGQARTISLEITTRGLTRRDKVCDFPPLKLWFDKKENKGTEFRGLNSLKMVTHCQANRQFEQYYIKEFLAYRIYNLITPYSFRVRPLMVSYQESGSSRKPFVRFGFLIEDIDDVADRLDLKELEIRELEPEELHLVETANLSLFQYLIGNLDWAATGGPKGEDCCHNGKLIGESNEARPVYDIPYDFDSSGLVDSKYAAPPTRLGVRKITDRLYRGFCYHNGEMPAALDRFKAQRQNIIDLFEHNQQLDNKSRSAAIRYIDLFYSSLDSEEKIQEELIGKCRG